ncbi:MAG: DUF5606 domain-containing protein [Weeksellaceae bacterium]|uniref:DUF5606 family protein n=1 Tax=Kaistella soli TaxID=2849654 RepID=UPI000B4AAE0D|nr:DUF5606 domain-containing protein [Kaistella soli]MBU4538635.1 DUF5606 domain-containing protein [Bacteroidota bacterium]MBU8881662.1 DUF5606 domain-containing protein [Kaistella soli]MCG2780948.1 DUF5606 domain-containing protein [Weeksellaceae bacterium]OWK74201.1 hypothetical protein CBW16_01945 [Flavobacteriaceae bacterium JJC]
MQLEKIISISGKPGLYKLISQLKSGFIIEDVLTKKKVSIGNTSQVSLLDNIAMFTFDKEVPLFEVFENVAKNNDYKETISHKSSDAELRAFMTESLPDYDTERVYVSDIKKLAQWYNILNKAGYITPESFVKAEVPAEEKTEEQPAEITEKKAAKKAAPKTEKAAAPKVKASTSSAKAAPKSTHRKMG